MDDTTMKKGIALYCATKYVTGLAQAKLPICATDGTVIEVAKKFMKFMEE